jgi:DNA-binding transcriptional LysR family regulator
VTTLDLPRAVAALTAEHPRLAVRLVEGGIADLTDQVAAARLDAAIIALPAEPPAGVQFSTLTRSRLHLHVPAHHKLATARAVSLRRLATLDFATLPPGTATRTALDRAFAALQAEPHIVFEAGDPTRVPAFTAAAGLPAVVPGMATAPGLTSLELTQPTIDSGIALATRTGGAEQPAVDAFVRHLVATAVH